MLGDPESKEGFLVLALQERNVGHYTCGHFVETLCSLYSQSLNPHYEKFCKVLRTLTTRQIKQLGLMSHAKLPGLKKCKLAAFEFLTVLLQLNPKLKLEELVEDSKVAVAYSSWRAKQQMLESSMVPSHPIDSFSLQIASSLDGSARFNTHSKGTSLQTDSVQSGTSSDSLQNLADSEPRFVQVALQTLLEQNPEGLGFYTEQSPNGRGFLRLNLNTADVLHIMGGYSSKNRSKGSTDLAESTQSGSNSAKGSHQNEQVLQLAERFEETNPTVLRKLAISTDKYLYSLEVNLLEHGQTSPQGQLCVKFGPRSAICKQMEAPQLCLTQEIGAQKDRSAEVATGMSISKFGKMSLGQSREHFLSEDAAFKVIKCTLGGQLILPQGFKPEIVHCLVQIVFYSEDLESNQGFLESLSNLTPKCLQKVGLTISSALLASVSSKIS